MPTYVYLHLLENKHEIWSNRMTFFTEKNHDCSHLEEFCVCSIRRNKLRYISTVHTCIRTYSHINPYVHTRAYIHTYTLAHTSLSTYSHIHTYVHTRTYIDTYILAHISIPTYSHKHLYLQTRTYIHSNILAHTSIRTYSHIHRDVRSVSRWFPENRNIKKTERVSTFSIFSFC